MELGGCDTRRVFLGAAVTWIWLEMILREVEVAFDTWSPLDRTRGDCTTAVLHLNEGEGSSRSSNVNTCWV